MDGVIAYLGLGSNLGDRQANLEAALRLLHQRQGVVAVSSVYETAPWGHLEQPDFLNCACAITASLPPQESLAMVQGVEKELGRRPSFRFGPRLIDVDILLYGALCHSGDDLEIPHPRMAERAFVLVPLAEIAPEILHPRLGRSIGKLAEEAEGKEGVRWWSRPILLP